jgi:hypothetical protein
MNCAPLARWRVKRTPPRLGEAGGIQRAREGVLLLRQLNDGAGLAAAKMGCLGAGLGLRLDLGCRGPGYGRGDVVVMGTGQGDGGAGHLFGDGDYFPVRRQLHHRSGAVPDSVGVAGGGKGGAREGT